MFLSKIFKKKERPPEENTPRILLSLPGSSGVARTTDIDDSEPPTESWTSRCCRFLYDGQKKLFCGRTCKSWLCIISYSAMYLIFLSTFTMILLFTSLLIIKNESSFDMSDKTDLLIYSEDGIGLTATPTAVNSEPVIWYKNETDKYEKYVKQIEDLLGKRHKRDTNSTRLGPCGVRPYGYGSNPCIIIRINKQIKWSAKPLNLYTLNDTHIPKEVRSWTKIDNQKLWLSCSGYHQYDREHIGTITYYPHPPGFDAKLFPMDMKSDSPIIAIQISNFSLGISLTIECTLWYHGGISSKVFMLYVTNKGR